MTDHDQSINIDGENSSTGDTHTPAGGRCDDNRPAKRLKQSTLTFSVQEEDLKKELTTRTEQVVTMQRQLVDMQQNIALLRHTVDKAEEHISVCRLRTRETMTAIARQERSEARRKLFELQMQIGYVVLQPTVTSETAEMWVWGQRHKDAVMQNKAFKVQRQDGASIRREDLLLKEKMEELERDKLVLIKTMRRAYDEDRSKYCGVEVLQDRYVMMMMLGRGGFSEVWKAYDTHTCQYVALKIHQVSQEWSEERRRNYTRHAKRECEVHMQLEHPRVIQLKDVEILDDNTFISVMEYSSGPDLDTYLKRNGTAREVDAKYILMQLLHGLRYLADHKERIIHYDLKPANILFVSDVPNCLDIKITDFGLCKIIGEGSHGDEIELTSQGTGTYWYLPPECFDTMNLPKISTKVDVWALGVVYFQMLFGRRPFGEGMTQKQVWHAGIISKAREVEFPARPTASMEAKEFIKKCLNPNPTERPDIATLMTDAHVVVVKKDRKVAEKSVS